MSAFKYTYLTDYQYTKKYFRKPPEIQKNIWKLAENKIFRNQKVLRESLDCQFFLGVDLIF